MDGGWAPTSGEKGDLAAPLFPLPNVVLFPRAVLPLHIFEERYKIMTAHALAGNGLIAMAMLRPGWEKNYHQMPAIEPAVCVGKIISAEKLPDGKYNLLLQGRLRGAVAREWASPPYRMGQVQAIAETEVLEIDLANARQRLVEMFCDGPMSGTPTGRQLKKFLTSSMPTRDVADLIAYYVLDDVRLKQALLAEGDVIERVRRLIAALPVLELAGPGRRGGGDLN